MKILGVWCFALLSIGGISRSMANPLTYTLEGVGILGGGCAQLRPLQRSTSHPPTSFEDSQCVHYRVPHSQRVVNLILPLTCSLPHNPAPSLSSQDLGHRQDTHACGAIESVRVYTLMGYCQPESRKKKNVVSFAKRHDRRMMKVSRNQQRRNDR